MRRILSISLLTVLMISIFPWEALALCPNKDGHHDGEEMHHGNCADGMMDNHDADEFFESRVLSDHILKGPSCTVMAPDVDAYKAGPPLIKPGLQQLAVLAVLFEWLGKPAVLKQEFYPAPEFHNKSGPPAAVNPLRGPPSFHKHFF